MRLQRFLAMQGLCSRRAAEEIIERGSVRINGRVAQLGDKVDPQTDKVIFRGRAIQANAPTKVTLAMNKPKGVVCTNHDPNAERTVFDLVPPPWNSLRLFCAGRLDKDSEGLVILTNDGDLSQQLSHPTGTILKRYQVKIHKPFQERHKQILLDGVEVEGERLQADRIILTDKGPDRERLLEIHLGHGRKREIRRMLEFLGYYVKKLRRFQIGSYVLRGLGPGRVVALTAKDIALLLR